ncbi:hypothetical protein TCAL_15237 [Tigriopus californicus]|uniref:WD repeat-containing protein 55 homolog n=1 Tax=Tigriopus californicus TaxID=6832 RepID=A0A553NBV7_TIGCA|nr:hypothetical protein TCAL_15237 [Tigriopus californicus]
MFRKFKGCVGAIRSIDCATNGYFASVGLDRFLRVYHVDRKKVKDFNAFVGCETGLLKGVSINPKCNISKNFHNLKCLNKEEEITALAFADRAHESEILLGLRNGSIRVFDTNELSIAQSLQGPTLPISPVVGVARTSDDTLVSAWQNGVVRVWKYQDELEILPIDVEIRSSAKWKSRNFASEEDEMKHLCSLKIDRHLCQMVAHPNQRHLMATGGKENDLQVWDLNRPEAPVFRARNVPLDSLQLRVPSFSLLYSNSSWVSVENSKLGPSTMASTGQASWQNPQYIHLVMSISYRVVLRAPSDRSSASMVMA